jgi:ATP-dependent DNA helicase RecQ
LALLQDLPRHKARQLEKLKYITFFATTTECFRRYILKCFGETASGAPVPDSFCGNCGNCAEGKFESVDITDEAKKIVSLVYRLESEKRRNYGVGTLVSVLLGKSDARVNKFGLQRHRLFGLLNGFNAQRLNNIFGFLQAEDFFSQIVRGDFTVITLGSRAPEVKSATFSLTAKLPPIKKKAEKIKQPKQTAAAVQPFVADEGLLEKLRALRSKIAKEEKCEAHPRSRRMLFFRKAL